MELWGGIECTVNRVGSRYFDQLDRNGHAARPEDLGRIADLGIRTLRYPILWERVQPRSSNEFEWAWSDARMERLSHLGIEPIISLLHHGSGPLWTNLLDPDFPDKLADYALAVARRYPWVRSYTPVNEPLTTARFSALYGHWFPHCMDDRSFTLALVHQIEGTIRAMQAIRSVHPKAKLVQTEDMGKTFSTPSLAYQANFENERRWLTFDFLSGRFTKTHPLWGFFVGSGVDPNRLEAIARNVCPPAIYGINYYVTSERYLDENLDPYPSESRGRNGVQAYADVAAVRGCPDGMAGIEYIMREVWARYGRPIAVTESHLGCTRDEQVRWLIEAWNAGRQLSRENIDVRAVTAWALFGAFDWDSLVTRETGSYEPGAFDIRGPHPRATAVARTLRKLSHHEDFDHPVLESSGWWQRPERLLEFVPRPVASAAHSHRGAPLLILGGAGNLGRTLGRVCQMRGLNCRRVSRYEADVCDEASLRRAIEDYRPWAVINAAGYGPVDEAESDAVRCMDVNARGAENAARICAAAGLPYVAISSDLVFDGRKSSAYVESDATAALSVFGRSKQEAEKRISQACAGALIIRTSPLFDPWNIGHFAARILLHPEEISALPIGRISPTYAIDLGDALLDLLIDEESGIWHLANVGELSWQEFAEVLRREFGLRALMGRLVPEERGAPRPRQSVLTSEKGSLMPSLENALSRFHTSFQPLLGRWREEKRPLQEVMAS